MGSDHRRKESLASSQVSKKEEEGNSVVNRLRGGGGGGEVSHQLGENPKKKRGASKKFEKFSLSRTRESQRRRSSLHRS